MPSQCNVGTKKNSKGYKESWTGYKLHVDCIDGDIPVSAILTSASLHDSQAAIPLAQMSAERITNLYDLMDAAYDAPQIHGFSESLGHRPIIDNNPRRGEKIHMDPATHKRFGQRSSVERVNAYLKDPWWTKYQGKRVCEGNDSFDVWHHCHCRDPALSSPCLKSVFEPSKAEVRCLDQNTKR